MDATIDKRARAKRDGRIEAPVVLYAVVPTSIYEAIRAIAFEERRSMADVTREALSGFLERRPERSPGRGTSRTRR